MRGRTLGIWGFGNVGQLVARFGSAFGMLPMIWGSPISRTAARAAGYLCASSADDLFAQADVLSLHLRLVAATQGLIDGPLLARMKETALLVNTSHAGLVVGGALESALAAGRPGFAAVDVFDEEPLPGTSDFSRYPNVLATPHLGWVEQANVERSYDAAIDTILAYAAGVLIAAGSGRSQR